MSLIPAGPQRSQRGQVSLTPRHALRQTGRQDPVQSKQSPRYGLREFRSACLARCSLCRSRVQRRGAAWPGSRYSLSARWRMGTAVPAPTDPAPAPVPARAPAPAPGLGLRAPRRTGGPHAVQAPPWTKDRRRCLARWLCLACQGLPCHYGHRKTAAAGAPQVIWAMTTAELELVGWRLMRPGWSQRARKRAEQMVQPGIASCCTR